MRVKRSRQGSSGNSKSTARKRMRRAYSTRLRFVLLMIFPDAEVLRHPLNNE